MQNDGQFLSFYKCISAIDYYNFKQEINSVMS